MSDKPKASDIPKGKRSDVHSRLVTAEKIQRGSNVPSNMQMYLAGYIDAHYKFTEELDVMTSTIANYDRASEE